MAIEEHTRRRFLATMGGAGAAAALSSGEVLAAPAPPDGGGTFGELPGAPQMEGTSLRTEAYPAGTPGTRYHFFNGSQFAPLTNADVYQKMPYLICTTSKTFLLSLNALPSGAVLSEVSFSVVKSSNTYTGNVVASVIKFLPYDGPQSSALVGSATTAAFPQMDVPQFLDIALTGTLADRTIDHQAADHLLVANIGANILVDVRVGYLPPATALGFYPIAPKRVYDSRRPNSGGALAAGASRVVSVKDGYINDTDTLDAPNVIPVGAKAIAYNLTIVGTAGAGYLSVGPGDAAAAAGSSINWSGPNQVAANGLTVTLDASRQVKVFAGPDGGTHFLIDVLGYYA